MSDFNPNWVSKPGDTMQDILDEKNMSLGQFANEMNLTKSDARQLIDADMEINDELANKLSSVLGASPQFWINREQHYRKELKRLNL